MILPAPQLAQRQELRLPTLNFAPHYRVVFGGTLTDPQSGALEIWQNSVNIVADHSPTASGGGFTPDGYLGDITAPLKSWFSDANTKMSTSATLTFIKCNGIGDDGQYTDSTATHVVDFTGVPGSANPNAPQIISTALSWFSAKARGPGSHGRIYPPNNTIGQSGSLLVSPQDCQTLATAGIALLTLLNNSHLSDTPGSNNVATPVIASGVNATNTDITGCRVGNVKDVQRRRKDALKEVYTPAVFLGVLPPGS